MFRRIFLLYSSDLASSDYYLFHFLQNSFGGKNFPNPEAIKIHFEQFFVEKSNMF